MSDYSRQYTSGVSWENLSSTATPISAGNLNKMDNAILHIDEAAYTAINTKANKTTVNGCVNSIAFESTTGVFTITFVNGSTTTINTALEKVVTNFTYNSATQSLVLTLEDGSTQSISLAEFITQYEFENTATIDFTVTDGKVSAIVKNGSITGEKLNPNYLTQITSQVNSAKDYARQSQSYALGNAVDDEGNPYREGQATDNAKHYYQKAREAASEAGAEPFIGATSSTGGTAGLVPAPLIADREKFLKGDGTWGEAGELSWTGTQAQWNALSSSEKAEYNGKKVYITDDYMQNIPVMIGASASDGGYKGLVPAPQSGDQDKTLQGNGTWGHKLVTDIVTQNGAYGYIGDNNAFVPFKSQADINAAVLAATIKVAALTQVETSSTDTITLSSLQANTYYFLFATLSYLAKPSDMSAINMIEVSGNYTVQSKSNMYHEKPLNYVQNSSTRIYVMSVCFYGKTGESGDVVFKIADGVTMPSEYNFKVKGFRVYTDLT